jgi:hypothetical protein
MQDDCVLEFSLPGLQRRRQHFTAQLAPAGAGDFGDPEGLACGNGHLYLAWARWEQVCMTGVPLQRLEQLQKPTGRDGSATITGCAAPEGEPWMLWGTCVGPDGALYAAANPEYAACPYTETPTELGRGRVLRAPVNSDGEAQAHVGAVMRKPCTARAADTVRRAATPRQPHRRAARVLRRRTPLAAQRPVL